MRNSRFSRRCILFCLLFFVEFNVAESYAQSEDRAIQVDLGFTYVHFQQQVKSEIGQPRGERIVYEDQLGLFLAGYYFVQPYFGIGLFGSLDRGVREQALFDGFDDEGRTKVRNVIGGSYTEFWFGPSLLARYRSGFFRVGYAAFGSRIDDARNDLPSSTGDTTSAFSTHPTIAWVLGLGATVELHRVLELLVEIQYRPRYYHLRGGDNLIGNVEHGTQSVAPLIGLRWTL